MPYSSWDFHHQPEKVALNLVQNEVLFAITMLIPPGAQEVAHNVQLIRKDPGG